MIPLEIGAQTAAIEAGIVALGVDVDAAITTLGADLDAIIPASHVPTVAAISSLISPINATNDTLKEILYKELKVSQSVINKPNYDLVDIILDIYNKELVPPGSNMNKPKYESVSLLRQILDSIQSQNRILTSQSETLNTIQSRLEYGSSLAILVDKIRQISLQILSKL